MSKLTTAARRLVSVDDLDTRELMHEWEECGISVPPKVIASPSKVIASPYCEIACPVLDYVKRVSRESPRTPTSAATPTTAPAQ